MIGTAVAQRMRNKIVMRRAFAEDGVPQPPFAAVRSLVEGRQAVRTVGLAAALEPADSGGQRGVFRIESEGDLERHLHAALAESASQECILEGFVEGAEMNGIVIARDGVAEVVTLSIGSDRPGSASSRLDPRLSGLRLRRSAGALGARGRTVRRGARPPRRDRLSAADRPPRWVGGDRRGRGADPGGQMADLVRHATGVDLVDIALRFALGEPVPDDVARPPFQQPLAIRFLTAEPGPCRPAA